MTTLLHYNGESIQFEWAKYNPETEELFVQFHEGNIYAYQGVPRKVWDDLLTAKTSTPEPTETTRGPVGDEKPGSEGSYFIYHIKGKNWRDKPPFPYRKLTTEEIQSLIAPVVSSEDEGF